MCEVIKIPIVLVEMEFKAKPSIEVFKVIPDQDLIGRARCWTEQKVSPF